MPLPLLCLLTAVPALQTPVPVGDAQAVLAAARAKAKSVMEARAAHIQAGKNTKDFRSGLVPQDLNGEPAEGLLASVGRQKYVQHPEPAALG